MQHWKDLGTAKRAWWILMTSEDYTCGPRFCSNRPKELVPSPISYWPSSSFNDRYQGEEIVWLHQTTNKISYRSKELSFIQAVNACYIDCCHSITYMITVFHFTKIASEYSHVKSNLSSENTFSKLLFFIMHEDNFPMISHIYFQMINQIFQVLSDSEVEKAQF